MQVRQTIYGQASFPHFYISVSMSNNIQEKGVNDVESETINVTRGGKHIKLTKSSMRKMDTKLPVSTAPPKYSSKPRPQFRLSASELRPCTPDYMIKDARAAIAASVSSSTQNSYNSAYNHLLKAEAILGRKFSTPPLDSEITFFITYLIQRNTAKSTVQSYLSALRFVSLSRGAQSHTPLPDLTSQLMSGVANRDKNAVKEALKCRRRPITLNMLILLR